ncbi:transcriptional regulator [Niallia circulans]|jgi:predicted transcriptional regulator|uniref:ArsR family transcriptional regulator n=1 Tax=Niallia circulans TaxID=1397 RepID=A0A0J1IIG0_NIACI|nr:helix-turn-helix domain-containing protein [Niallia circulans]KLV25687.1 ArsR family transcriptional regulator [Niallia circulans]MED5102374.1 helix-turn-helix domain-containing protein [Niallia circulans]NRG31169.1 helix-turn-helix domain-containing protein [Niallia circulans]PAD24854.1 transcriptional regulator [Niallia circulans]PAD88917.1 transcriptional regulator [Niallia circulans]
MQLGIDKSSLVVYEALASEVRMTIIQLLSKNKMNIKELAKELGISSAIVTKHVKKLEDAGLIKTEKVPGKSGLQKISMLKVDHIEINFPKKIYHSFASYETSVPIGHYTDYDLKPTCGLASEKDFIGRVDEPKLFMDPKRVEAEILWFTQGFIQYTIPNFLKKEEKIQQFEISLEVCSEFPFSNDNWPSDITFSLNGLELGTWRSPGDFADTRGKLTPEWWPHNLNQYGLLKTLRITNHGTYIDGDPISAITINELDDNCDRWTFRIEVKEDAEYVGGATIFGKKFGNHPQDIIFKVYYL